MKHLLIIICCLLMAGSISAKDVAVSKAPKRLQLTLTKLYPEAKDIKWTKEDDGMEASFKLNDVKTSLVFDKDGAVKETETEIEVSKLPASISKYISENHKGYKLSEAAKIVDSKGAETYEAEITKGKVKKDILFDKTGKLIKK